VEEFYVTHRRPKFHVELNFKNSEEIWKKNVFTICAFQR
jgi:hypothetical protein